MKQSQLLSRLLGAATLGGLAAGAVVVPTDALAGIANTKHNLGASSNSNSFSSTGGSNGEICVFCHTPHAADNSAPVPLWNKKLPTSATTYNTYENLGGTGSSTIDGVWASDGPTSVSNGKQKSVGSVSLACLSCHDGTQAMDNVLNAPGFGNYSSDGSGANGRSWAINSSVRMDGTGKLVNGGTSIAALGTDLTNDHPIGIAYCGWSSTAPTGTALTGCGDSDFVNPTKSGSRWWVDTSGTGATGNTGVREKTDMILYTRTGSNNVSGPFVECASCHDPHVGQKTTNEVAFMRVQTANSQICLSCHAK